MRSLLRLGAFLVLLSAGHDARGEDDAIVIGSKTFGESYLLGEIFAQVLEAEGFTVTRRFGLGGTLICTEALREGEVDVYPEYTGTITRAILRADLPATEEAVAARSRSSICVRSPPSASTTPTRSPCMPIALKPRVCARSRT